MLEKVKETVAEALGADINTITAETSFKEDLGADSLDLFEMVMSLEDTCGVEIPTEDLETMVTVGDVAEYLEQHKKLRKIGKQEEAIHDHRSDKITRDSVSSHSGRHGLGGGASSGSGSFRGRRPWPHRSIGGTGRVGSE